MSGNRHIVYLYNKTTKGKKKMTNIQKEVQVKLAKGLLDVIVLQFLNDQPMHGYQIISQIRKSFGVYFGPSTVYPLLGTMEKKGYVASEWNMENDRPRKVYRLTNEGQNILNFTENSLSLIVKKIGTNDLPKIESEAEQRTVSVQYFPGKAKKVSLFTQ
ncbi:TPA: PadR family transcriptional regulator [Candidatus Bathyarchaeota archaeon]|nr:PadR family transcriptional regulator [Candidatus Bathyarchaeota archaeon]